MDRSIRQYDVVTLVKDLPKHGLLRGQVGTVVEQYAPEAFEVEFIDVNGRTYALATLQADQIMVLRYEPAQIA